MVQLREKDLAGGRLLELATSLKQCIKSRALLIINERVDVALAAQADGVQLAEDGMPVQAARRIMGPQALIGRSVHSEQGAMQAADQGVDFLVAGAIYGTRSHPEAPPAGPGLVSRINKRLEQRAVSLPVIGIGGITVTNLDQVMVAGAAGVAVITSILASPDPKGEAGKLKQAMLDVWSGGSARVGQEAEGSNATT